MIWGSNLGITKGKTNYGTSKKELAGHQRREHVGTAEEARVWVSEAAWPSGSLPGDLRYRCERKEARWKTEGIRFPAPAGSLGCDVIGLLAFLPWERDMRTRSTLPIVLVTNQSTVPPQLTPGNQ